MKLFHWFSVEILNCKLQANDSKKRNQIHQINAESAEQARELAPKILSHLFGANTWVGDVSPPTRHNRETMRHTRGRGSNPASKANLRKPKTQWFVYSRGAGIGWSKEFGPMTLKKASEIVRRLEALNHTGKIGYCVSTDR